MGHLTTHVLDTAQGKPAAGIKIELYSLDGKRQMIKSIMTNADGRCGEPLLAGAKMEKGHWELLFYVGEYFAGVKDGAGSLSFLDEVPVRFAIENTDSNYHIPLLVSPWSYTTYRGS